MRAQTAISIYFPFVALLSELAAAAVLGSGVLRVVAGTMTVGTLIAFVLYLDSFFTPIQQLSQVFDSYQQAQVGLVRIGELLDTPTSTPAADAPAAGARAGRGHRRGRGGISLLDRGCRCRPRADRGRSADRGRPDGRGGRRDRGRASPPWSS